MLICLKCQDAHQIRKNNRRRESRGVRPEQESEEKEKMKLADYSLRQQLNGSQYILMNGMF